MTASERSVPNIPSSVNTDPNIQDAPWAIEGILAGVLGAATVAPFELMTGTRLPRRGRADA